MESTGEEIKRRRTYNKMSLEQASEAIGITVKSLKDIENNRVIASATIIYRLAILYGELIGNMEDY